MTINGDMFLITSFHVFNLLVNEGHGDWSENEVLYLGENVCCWGIFNLLASEAFAYLRDQILLQLEEEVIEVPDHIYTLLLGWDWNLAKLSAILFFLELHIFNVEFIDMF